MTIRFGGIDCFLEDPTGEVDAFIRRHWDMPSSPVNCQPRTISPQTFCQLTNAPPPPVLKINQLYIPSLATRWSRVLLLMDDQGVQNLSNVNYGVLEFGLEYPTQQATALTTQGIRPFYNRTPTSVAPPNDVSWDMGGNYKIVMFKLDPIPVAWMGEKRLYIVPIVDERFYWSGVNLVTQATVWGTSSAPPMGGGVTLFNDIAKALASGALGSPTATDYIAGDLTPISQPSCQAFRDGPIPAAAALDLFCWSQNLMLVPDYNTIVSVDGDTGVATYNVTTIAPGQSIQRYRVIGEGNATGPKSTGIWHGQEYFALCPPLRIQSQLSPQSVAGYDRMGSAKAYDHPGNVTMTFTNPQDTTQVQYTKTITATSSSSSSSSSSAVGQMWIRCLAAATSIVTSSSSSSSSSGPGNQSELDAIATSWINRWYVQNGIAFEWVFNQMPLLKFCGAEDYVLMDMGRKDNTYSGTTRWVSLPSHFGYEYVAIGSTTSDCIIGSPGGGGGCDCCDCFACLQPLQATIGSCTAAPNGAAYQYTLDMGIWAAYPAFSDGTGHVIFTYGAAVDCSSSSSSSSSSSVPAAGCVWYSCPRILAAVASSSSSSSSAPMGTYQLQLVFSLNGDGETVAKVFLVWLGIGTDVLGVGA